MNNFKFGDLLENGWTNEKNPLFRGVFVRKNKKTFLLTDMKGKFWETYIKTGTGNHKLKKIASVITEGYFK